MDLINTKQRIALFTETLKQPNLDFDIIANLSFNGIPDIHRPIYWRILLKYLPTKKEKWIQVLKNKRNSYNIYQEEFIDSSFKSICYEFLVKDSFNLSMIRQKTQGTKIKEKDLKIIENIIKDVSRTQLDYDLCREDENNDSLSNNSISNNQAISPNNDNQNSEKNNENENENENKNKKNKENEKNGENQIEEKIENKNPKSKGLHLKYQMCEIIYLFTRLNSGFGFVQGMSEILVPIFCLFKNDPNEEWRKFSNHDTFFCFTNLMSEIGHHFCQDFDQTDLSIHASLQRVDQLVAFFDPKLASHFVFI
ncbi:tbc1 domain family member 13 [Anaeramoeba ignava]|uniref:Tbc1 domain family member 13 n=1 Tax=Anaeramoeba ignava TaxID=1746090 RepID=A0A9Q0L7S7_ANAIG|nr:tbc1 domain family member 13 [Anaeramoeba ignava]